MHWNVYFIKIETNWRQNNSLFSFCFSIISFNNYRYSHFIYGEEKKTNKFDGKIIILLHHM